MQQYQKKSIGQKIIKKYNGLPIQVKASFWFLICTILQRSSTIIATPIFTRLLSTSEYGVYSTFISWMGILICFVTMSMYSGIYTQAIVKFDDHREQFSSAIQGLTVILVVIWLVIYFVLSDFWNRIVSLNTQQMIAMFIVMWTNAIFGFWSSEQRVDYKYFRLVTVTLIESILQPVLCVVFIYMASDKVTGVVWGIAIATLVSYTPLFLSQMMKGKQFFSKEVWLYALKLAIPLIPHYLSSVILNGSDRIMIQKMVGEAEAGIYNLAYTISICGVMINQAVLQTVQPWIYQKIKAQRFKDIKKVAYSSLIGIAGVNLFIVVFAPEIVKIFAPSSYFNAIWVMPPIIMSVFFMYMYNLLASFEFYYEKTIYISTATMIGAALNIILNYIFIGKFGYYAAGYTTLVCYIIFAVAHGYFMRKICSKEIGGEKIYNVKILTLISLGFIITGFALMITYRHTAIRYSLIAVVFIVLIIKRQKLFETIKVMFQIRKK